MAEPRRIGILTSGGDCAGLNAVIRAVVHRAIGGYGWRVIGILDGTAGLMRRPVACRELALDMFDGNILRQGGTMLGTNSRDDPFDPPRPDEAPGARADRIIEGYRLLGLDALIVVGGDGSMEIARRLAEAGGLNLIGVPKTIDNDVALTENSVGFGTAVDVATEALDRLQPTAASHSRVHILQVMGRDAGHIAINAGIAGGADIVLIPEIPYGVAGIVEKLERIERQGRNFALVVVAEAVVPAPDAGAEPDGGRRCAGIGERLGALIADRTGAEVRVTVLGHIQRGGAPSPRDRLFAAAFGVRAVDLIAEGKLDRMVAWSNRDCIDVPLEEVVARYQAVDPEGALVRTARGLGIYIGT